MTISPKPYITQFVQKEKLTEDTFTFHFKKPAGFTFLPGQYNRWTLSIENPDARGGSRYFTIAESPLGKEFITITTRIIQSSFKMKLSGLVPEDEMNFFGPLGNFVLDEEDLRPKVFLAGGIGIIPFYSMLTYAFQKKFSNRITLLASFSNKEEIIFFDELSKIPKELPNIKVIYTLTHSTSSGQAKEEADGFESGRISEDMIKKYADVSSSVFYIVGPPGMVTAIEELVAGMGVSEERVKIENFTGY